MGYVETVIFHVDKFSYKWYQSYGLIIVTLDWIHGNAWEDKRKGNIYELDFGFSVMMRYW